MAELQPSVDAALKVADQVGTILRERAILDNEDCNGNQFPQKQARPKGDPQNFPNIALIQDDEIDEMNPSRWSVEQSGLTEVVVTYQPSEHHDFLVEKAPEKGGRNWINQDAINPEGRRQIEQLMAEAMGG